MLFVAGVGVLRGYRLCGVFTEPSQLIPRRLQVSTDGEQRRQQAINPSCVAEEAAKEKKNNRSQT
jgi:hypothetical protein